MEVHFKIHVTCDVSDNEGCGVEKTILKLMRELLEMRIETSHALLYKVTMVENVT